MKLRVAYTDWLLKQRSPFVVESILSKNDKHIKKYIKLWKGLFKKHNIDKNDLKKYFAYQSYRFRSFKFIPPLNVLFSEKSLLKFKEAKEQGYLDKLIGHIKKKKILKGSIIAADNVLASEDKSYLQDDKFKTKHIEKNSYKGIYDFCVTNYIQYNNKSSICKKCPVKLKCQKNSD